MKVVMISRGLGDYVIELLNALSKKVELYFIVPQADEWIVDYLSSDVKVIFSNAPRVSHVDNIKSI